MVLDINSSSKHWNYSFPIKCECGKQIQSTSLFRHRKSKAHILEMKKPENKDNKPDFNFLWREACQDLDSD